MDTDAVSRLLRDVAAEVITPRFRALDDAEVHEKNPGDLVTDADREAEVLLTRALTEAYPDAVVLGEEAHAADASVMDAYLAADHAFTVDPVDGTKNFVHGSDDHAVMVSESRGRELVRAWIWQPQHEVMYVAERGAGAYADGEQLTVPTPAAYPDWRGVTSTRRQIGTSLGAMPPLELTWVCCGVDYPKLIEGAATFMYYTGTKPWDHAPGALLLHEAGGFLGTGDGRAYDPQAPAPTLLLPSANREVYDTVLVLIEP